MCANFHFVGEIGFPLLHLVPITHTHVAHMCIILYILRIYVYTRNMQWFSYLSRHAISRDKTRTNKQTKDMGLVTLVNLAFPRDKTNHFLSGARS